MDIQLNRSANAIGRPSHADESNSTKSSNTPSVNQEGEKNDDRVAVDSAQFSQQSLQLASTSTVRGAQNQTQISGEDEAKDAARELQAQIKAQPAMARQAFGSVASANVGQLLTDIG